MTAPIPQELPPDRRAHPPYPVHGRDIRAGGAQRDRILSYVALKGADGAIYTDIMQDLEIGAPTVTARVRELMIEDRLRDSGARRATPSGRLARVLVAR